MGTRKLLAVNAPCRTRVLQQKQGYNSHLINTESNRYQKAVGGNCTVQILLQQKHGYNSHLINTEPYGYQKAVGGDGTVPIVLQQRHDDVALVLQGRRRHFIRVLEASHVQVVTLRAGVKVKVRATSALLGTCGQGRRLLLLMMMIAFMWRYLPLSSGFTALLSHVILSM